MSILIWVCTVLPISVCLKTGSLRKYSFHLSKNVNKLGDDCIQIFRLGKYIVGYTVGNFVLWRRVSISQNILLQIFDVVQSDVALYSQVH